MGYKLSYFRQSWLLRAFKTNSLQVTTEHTWTFSSYTSFLSWFGLFITEMAPVVLLISKEPSLPAINQDALVTGHSSCFLNKHNQSAIYLIKRTFVCMCIHPPSLSVALPLPFKNEVFWCLVMVWWKHRWRPTRDSSPRNGLAEPYPYGQLPSFSFHPPWSGFLLDSAAWHANLVIISVRLSSSYAGLDKNRQSSF